MLRQAHLPEKENNMYIFWSVPSCEGCRHISVNTLLQNPELKNRKIIVPIQFAHEVKSLEKEKVFIDSLNIFNKKYFGIANVGFVLIKNEKIVEIKDYKATEMKEFENNIINQM